MSSYFAETEEVIIGFRANLLYKRLVVRGLATAIHEISGLKSNQLNRIGV